MTCLIRLAFVTAVVAPALITAASAQPVRGPYVSLGAGTAIPQDQSFTQSPQFNDAERSFSFDPGFAGLISSGWGFGNGLRLEVEGNFTSQHVSAVHPALDQRAGGHEQLFGGFVNALYDFDVGLPVFPYVGVGAGGQELQASNVNYSSVGYQFGRHANDQYTGGFAYQAIAGLAVPVPQLRGLSLTAEYRFVGLADPLPANREQQFDAFGLRTSGNGKFGNVYDHELLIGVRYAFDTPRLVPVAPAPMVPAAPPPAAARTYLVFFDWDRADLGARARQIVAEAADAATHVRSTRIAVDGYTDRSGTVAYNQALSIRRAEAVAAELVHDGIARDQIGIEGYGERNPLVPTANGVREAQNRRVEIVLQ